MVLGVFKAGQEVAYLFLVLEDAVQSLGQSTLIELNLASIKQGGFEIQTR